MYVQKLFEESRASVMHALMRQYSLASLVLMTPDGMEANSLPMEIDSASSGFGTLRCHFGRNNPAWKSMVDGAQAMAIFHGPNAYLSPRWYVAGQKSRKVLPSWNFAAVHAYGVPRIVDDKTWMLRHLAALATQNERHRPHPWSLAEALPEFVEQSAEHIIGIEITVSKLVGKWFVSQQRTAADRASLVNALRACPHDVTAATADLIEQVDQPPSYPARVQSSH